MWYLYKQSIVFLHIRNEYYFKIKKTIMFITASKRIKYLGLNLTKEVQILYAEIMKYH